MLKCTNPIIHYLVYRNGFMCCLAWVSAVVLLLATTSCDATGTATAPLAATASPAIGTATAPLAATASPTTSAAPSTQTATTVGATTAPGPTQTAIYVQTMTEAAHETAVTGAMRQTPSSLYGDPPASQSPAPAPTTAPRAPNAVTPTTPPVSDNPTPTLALTAPAVLRVSRAGCCDSFGWSADNRVYFYDAPSGGQAGTYVVAAAANATPRLLTPQLGAFTPDLALVAQFGAIAGERPGFGANVTISAVNGATVAALLDASPTLVFSPDTKHFAYLRRAEQQDGPERPQIFDLWTGDVANPTRLRQIGRFREAADLAWLPDNTRVVFSGRDSGSTKFGAWRVDTTSGATTQIVDAKGLRGLQIAPDGRNIVYYIAFQPDAAANGLWVSGSDGSNRKKLPFSGTVRWSPDSASLLYAPADGQGHVLWRYTTATGATTKLIEADAATPFRLADTWQVAPDGRRILFRAPDTDTLTVLQFVG